MTTRSEFDVSLKNLQQDLLRMGALVEEQIEKGIEALVRQDVALADAVVANDDEIDRMQLTIEDRCMKLIAMQQPMAKDLRRISAAWRITIDLERMSDNIVDIAKAVRRLAQEDYFKPLVVIQKMAQICQCMVKDGLDAYVYEDEELAIRMSELDHQVDALYKEVLQELLAIMIKDPQKITQSTHLLFVARYLERFGDHATNIAETIVYLVSGKRKDLNE
ncbi:phosphate transport system regulatory protein phou [Heliomicrobium modesticaldum Ice1]|uniref:Phosphate-specific transport system accessory protein PhoU n=1 Tax=Heliobacterium modesticaldum (strain ATCC 51547 / Ice1) TaxID=498761 RepID=B0TGE7_HELMI|nr:phosphate signaling complex protein PhoU [Heliomicrobium modesticaldum]ABZ84643.1 phosphate transport system regulatory protein phou [Heliomicrobium modesticaldum Ice1]